MNLKGVARNGDTINEVTASNHVTVRKWNSNGDNPGYYMYDDVNATISGSINEGNSSAVYANGILASVQGSRTLESDDYSSSWDYYSGKHTNATSGSVASGSSTVFIGGIPIARMSDNISTHAGVLTTIKDGSTNVFAG